MSSALKVARRERRSSGLRSIAPLSLVALVASLAFLFCVPACSVLLGLDDVVIVDSLDAPPPDAASPQDATSDGTSPDAACPSGRGPTMTRVGAYCIDTTEVTNAQYAPFLDAVASNPAIVDQPSDACSWNTDFNPDPNYPQPKTADGNDPVRAVDWCDAYAFCRWANKRLCGSLGGAPSPYTDFASPQNEWYLACSSNRKYTYTFGSTFDAQACNAAATGVGEVAHVTAFPRCHPPAAPFSSLYDMAGNVLEWENSCASSAADAKCLTRGGWFKSDQVAELACDKNGERARNDARQGVGIRCCSP